MVHKKKTQKSFPLILIALIGLAIVSTALFIYWYYSLKPPALPFPPLKDLAAKRKIELGIHVDPKKLNERIYPDIVSSEFNLLTIDGGGSHFKEIQPAPAKYDFTRTDKMVQFAEQHNMPVQFHHLVWGDDYMLPDWLMNGNYSKEQIMGILHDHINTIMTRYKGRVQEYSLINEAFTENQHIYGLKNWWADHVGNKNQYIDQLFIWAHQADPNAKLLVNDFRNEEKNSVSNDIYDYIKSAKNRGIPIDGVGMQLHVNAAYPPNKQSVINNMKRFMAIKVPVYITEFDVNTNSVKGSSDYKQQLETSITQDMVRACVESKACVSFTVFGITSKNDFIKKLTRTNSRAYMFDSRFRPRQSFYAFRSAWQ